jgi:hypothetical protein
MRVLRQGHRGEDVERWQLFLIGQGLDPGEADSIFGARTREASKGFQSSHQLEADGIVGVRTLGRAMALGFDPGVENDGPPDDEVGANWPPPPLFPALTTTAARQQLFGRFDFVPKPVPGNPEAIQILGSWVADNIQTVTIPQLAGVEGAPANGRILTHKAIAPQLLAMFRAWEQAGLLPLVKSWAGSFAPRFVRGSRTNLSNHAFGTAFDINARHNPLGTVPPLVGRPGSVRKLVPIANAHGFYWGGHFNRPDGMHFEAALLLGDSPGTQPPEPPPTPSGGRAILTSTLGKSVAERERIWLEQLRSGNFPDFLRTPSQVHLSALLDGTIVDASLDVLADYVAVGTNEDFVRVPFGQRGAIEAAAILGGILPTARIVDAIYAQADIKLAPVPKPPVPEMTGVPYILEHHDAVEAKRAGRTGLIAGHKKDVVLTNRLGLQPARVAIYGWHQLNGVPIQPLSLRHESTYADYSHGVRVVGPTIRIDGQPMLLRDVLADPDRAALVSGEGTIVVSG